MSILQGLVSHSGSLYAAWKGEPGDERIFYSRWNGSGNWAASATVGGKTSTGPALGSFNGSLYAAWKGEWDDPRLYFAPYDGTNWKNQIQIPNAYSDVGPALCGFGGTQLIAAWKSIDQSLYFASYDGSHWTVPSTIGAFSSTVGPSLATYGGKLYAVWKGGGSDDRLWYATYDGAKWSGQNAIPGVASSVGASLAGVGNKLYAAWKGEGSDERLWYATYDGTKWSDQSQISGANSSVGAAIAEFNGQLYAMAKGKDADTSLYSAGFSGSAWPAFSKAIPGNTGPDTPATLTSVPPGGNSNYLLADSKGAVLTGTTVTIIVVEDIVPDSTENYSFQINCYDPSPASGPAAFVWQQYGFRIAANQLFFWVNDFRKQDLPGNPLINWDSRALPNDTGVLSLQNNVLPKDLKLTTTLATDANGNVTGFSFRVANAGGPVLKSPALSLLSLPSHKTTVVAANLAPIANYQVIMVGENGGTTTDFSAGKGIIACDAANNLSATASQDESGEGSNVKYAALPASYPDGKFFQFFGIPPL
jgi:hypothetical protein